MLAKCQMHPEQKGKISLLARNKTLKTTTLNVCQDMHKLLGGFKTYPLHPGVLQHLASTQAVFGVPNQKFGY